MLIFRGFFNFRLFSSFPSFPRFSLSLLFARKLLLAFLKIAHLACRFRKADVRDATQKGPRAIFSQGRRVETPFRADRRRFDDNPIGILINGRVQSGRLLSDSALRRGIPGDTRRVRD